MKNKFLFLVMGLLLFSFSYANDFKDVSKEHWAYDSIKSMHEQGIISGYSDNTFRPNNIVTREQFATMFVKAFSPQGKYEGNLVDVANDSWSREYIEIAANYIDPEPSYIDNRNGNKFEPYVGITRYDVAHALTKHFAEVYNYDQQSLDQFSDIGVNDKYIATVVSMGIMSGYPDGTFKSEKTLTRAEAAIIIQNAINNLPNVYYVCKQNEKYGVIDCWGNLIIDTKYDDVHIPDKSRDIFLVRVEENYEVKYKAFNKNNERILAEYDNIQAIRDERVFPGYFEYYIPYLIVNNKDNKYGVINLDGEEIIPVKYDEIKHLDCKPDSSKDPESSENVEITSFAYASIYEGPRPYITLTLGNDVWLATFGGQVYEKSYDKIEIVYKEWSPQSEKHIYEIFGTKDGVKEKLDIEKLKKEESYYKEIELVSESLGDVWKYDDDSEAYKKVSKYDGDNRVYLLEEDFDNDGELEAFGIVGKYNKATEEDVEYGISSEYYGTLCYFDEDGHKWLTDEDRSYLEGFEYKDLGKQKLVLITEHHTSGDITKVWDITTGNPVLIVDNVQLRINEDNTVESLVSSYDAYYDTSTLNCSGHTWKEYFFYVKDGELKEYGARNISLEQLLMFEGAKEIVDKISKNGKEIVEILYRENGIIIINEKTANDNEGSYSQYHTVLKYDKDSVEEIKLNQEYMGNSGHYLKEIVPKIATYPSKFIIPNNKNVSKNDEILRLTGISLDFAVSDWYDMLGDYLSGDYPVPEENIPLLDKIYSRLYDKYLTSFPIWDDNSWVVSQYTASSTYSDGKIDYSVENLKDESSRENSWVEGVAGYGIGEKITLNMTMISDGYIKGNLEDGYYFEDEKFKYDLMGNEPYETYLTGFYIVNGYAKNETLWRNNSRVKKLKLTLDDKEEFILELDDTMNGQLFSINYKKSDYNKLYPIKAVFEILEVYEGDKFEDTAINVLTGNCYSNVTHGR